MLFTEPKRLTGRKMKSLLLFLSILLVVPAHATASFARSQVSKIVMHDWGHVFIYPNGDVQTNENCTNKNFIVLKRSNQRFSEMFASVLAAYHSGREISGWMNDCSPNEDAPIIIRLDIL